MIAGNKLFFLLLLLILPFTAICQITPSVPKWVTDFGSSNGSAITSASRTDAQNNVYVTGPFFGTVDFDPSAGVKNLTSIAGSADIFVAKYNTDGALVWVVAMGGSEIDQGNGISVDNIGNIAVVGQFYSSSIDADPGAGTFNLSNSGNADMFVINLDVNGNFIWAKSIGASGADFLNKVAIDNNSNKIIGGQFQGSISVGNQTVSTSASFGAFVAKYNNTGNVLWAFNLGTTGNNLVTGASTDSNNDIIVSGTFNGTVNFNPLGSAYNVTANPSGAFVAKYTPAGQLLWVKSVSGNILASNLAVNSHGDVYTISPFTSTISFDSGITLPLIGSRSVSLAKYKSDGTLLWAKGIGGANSQITNYEVAAGSDDNVYFSGFFIGTIDFDPSAGQALITDHGVQDLFLAKYDTNGNYKWAINSGNSCSNNIGRTVAVDSNNDVLFGGAFCSTVNFDVSGCTTYNVTAQSATRDGFLAKYIPAATGLANNDITAPAVSSFCGPFDPAVIIGSIPTGGAGIYDYHWQSSANGVNFTDIPGALGKDYDPPSIATTMYYRRMVGSGSCNLDISSNTVQIIQQNTTANNTITAPSVIQFCASGDPGVITGSTPTGNDGIYAYQWQSSADGINFSDLAGAVSKDFDPSVINNTTYFRRIVNPGGCEIISNAIQINVQPLITDNNLPTPAITSFCIGTEPDIFAGSIPTGGNGSYTYQWQSSTNGVDFLDIAQATSVNYDPAAMFVTTYYRRRVFSGDCAVLSNVIIISVQPPVTNNQVTTPSATSFCSSVDPDPLTGSVPTGGDGAYTYQWQSSIDGINFTDIPGATLKDYDPPVINAEVYFQRVVASGSCATSVSNIIYFFAQPPITNNQISAPATAEFCGNGDPDIIPGSAPAGGSGAYNYQWQSSADGTNFTDITGAVSIDYDPPVINSTVYYRRKVVSGACETLSNVIQITVQPAVSNNTITAQPPTAFCGQGDAGIITGNIPPGAFTYNYQWQSSIDNTIFTDIPGAITNNYDPPLISTTTYYRRIVSSAVCVVPLISNVVVIQIDPALADNIITAPSVSSFCDSGDADIVIGSIPTGGNGTINYQWQSSADGVNFSDVSGADQKDFDPALLNSSIFYRRIITSGNCTIPLVSNVVKINIDPLITGNSIVAPAVTAFCGNSQPGMITGSTPSGGNGTFVYQWQSSTDNTLFSDILNATQKDYTPGVLTSNIYFRRTVTSGSCALPVISNSLLIQIEPPVQNNIITSPVVSAFCSTGDASIITSTTPTGGNGTYAYQWQSSADGIAFNDIGGATAQNYDPPVSNSTTYFRRLVSSNICNIPQSSNVIIITIDVMPVIALGPEVTICLGSSTLLNQQGGNSSYTYQWSPAAGLSNPNIASPVAAPLVTTNYTLTVSNGTCITTSTINVKVIPRPTVNAGKDKEILKGNSVLLDAVTTGDDLQYSWSPALYLDNPNIATPIASPPEDITYTLTVTSANNCFIVFDDVFIKVYPKIAPPNTFTPNNDGINDVWEIAGLSSYANSVVSIFNRNGELLHRSAGYTSSWDGTYKGRAVPFGTYYYTIDLKNGAKVLSGWVAVVK